MNASGLLLRTLGALLGKPGVMAAVLPTVEVSLRERVVNMGAQVHTALSFGQVLNKLDGELRIEKAVADAEGNVAFSAPVSVHKIAYRGLNMEKLNLVFNSPNAHGEYRVAFYLTGSVTPAGSDELFVQYA